MAPKLILKRVKKWRKIQELRRRRRRSSCKESRPRLEVLEPRHLLTVTWDGGGDGTSWRDAANWSGNALPTSADDVVIDVPVQISIVHNVGSDTVKSLRSAESLSLTGGNLTVLGTFQVDNLFSLRGGTLAKATITAGAGGRVTFTNSGGTLDGVTANTDLDFTTISGAQVHVVNGLTLNATAFLGNAAGSTYGGMYFDGTQTLGGTGDIVFGKSVNNYLRTYDLTGADVDTLTIAPSMTVRGSSGTIADGYLSTNILNKGTIAADDSGGLSSFEYDNGFDLGYALNTAATIDTSGVTNPAPQVVYQTAHYYPGTFSNTLLGLAAGSYTLRLHFAELQNLAVGDRQFHVDINGTRVLQNFDIVAAAGGANKAVVQEFTATADADGKLKLDFVLGAKNYPAINGIELLSGDTVVRAINAGLLAGGSFTINVGSPGTELEFAL